MDRNNLRDRTGGEINALMATLGFNNNEAT